MDETKISNWERSNTGNPFPSWRQLSEAEATSLRFRLLFRSGMSASADPLDLVKWLASKGMVCEGGDANLDGFDLMALMGRVGIHPKASVYLNWYRFDDIDVMSTDQLSRYFSDIWYPSVDDLDIFDDSLDWVLMVRHYGTVSLVQFPQTIDQTGGSV